MMRALFLQLPYLAGLRVCSALALVACLAAGSAQAADQGPRPHARGQYDTATATYVVVEGDDLAAISERFEIPVDKLKEQNQLGSNEIEVGQKLVVAIGTAEGGPASTPQITGVPGSPSATTTISGKQLPPPDPKFGGVIKERASESKAWWPPNDVGGTRRQFHHLIDIVPTILEATGIPAPDTLNGIKQRPMDGVSMAYTWDKANANAPSRHTTQYFELLGNRAIYHDGWLACTTPVTLPWELSTKPPPDVITGYNWELYNVMEDPTEFNDLATKMPEKVKQMQDLFYAEAKKFDVLPLDNTTLTRWNAPKPNLTAGRTVFTYTGGLTGVPNSGAPNILNKSYTITAEVTIPEGGAEGMIVTDGGRFGGYGLFLSKGEFGFGRGKVVFLYNLLDLKRTTWEGPELSPGKHIIVFDFKFDGPGLGKGGTGVLSVDGQEVARNSMEHTTPITFPEDETFDLGQDTRTPLALIEYRYDCPFKFTGKINKLTFDLGPEQLRAEERGEMQKALARARDEY